MGASHAVTSASRCLAAGGGRCQVEPLGPMHMTDFVYAYSLLCYSDLWKYLIYGSICLLLYLA
jgi:hypothetical protein